ncbi:MAG: Rne/Rng family ribonuclease [Hyphomicrobiales bacterium]|nr:Rne/Rng family ribonuclease [Hyphomicrobiales bacterium]
MPNKMLIDSSHPEETRVVVTRGNRVEEFDFESASKKQLRGNIYLAKVTRVEPSLQAAFVDYGGNRHGFLAFSEIHPDYYQIPVADRQALLEEEAAHHEEEEEERPRRRSRRRRGRERRVENGEAVSETAPTESENDDHASAAADAEADANADLQTPATPQAAEPDAPAGAEAGEAAPTVIAVDPHGFAAVEEGSAPEEPETIPDHETKARRIEERDEAVEESDEDEDEDEEEEEHVEQIGGDAMEEMPRRQPRSRRQYKIQEVIKRRQVLLVQVVKEERGNKGAALTTYLSLAGRYSVLMPNTARGGGISRKITDGADRKRMKEIAQDLEVPEGMGVILRTAGASRTRAEVKRDFEYLMRMWETVRETTLESTAPTLVYEEGSLIKRAIRDLYNKDVDEVIVSGANGYREAKDFMRLLMPSHSKNVHLWREPQALFTKSGVESQLDAMFSNQVTLKSGGYLVINQTEALVAIDVNSGRSTREHNIEDTALRTNLEAADEVARQLRLRDLAGLIVVDFIDMEENRNNRAVERRLKDALKNDRARIQVGRISHFGLLEMSRQRIRTGVFEGSTTVCPHCSGAGMVRSTSSIALHVLRVLEEALLKSATHNVIVKTRTPVALYILNQKRAHLREIERRFGVEIFVMADDSLTGSTYHALERGEVATGTPIVDPLPAPEAVEEIEEDVAEEDVESDADDENAEADGEDAGERAAREGEDGEGKRRRRRRRRGRGRSGERENGAYAEDAPQPSDEGLAALAQDETANAPVEKGPGFWARENSNEPEPFHPAQPFQPAQQPQRAQRVTRIEIGAPAPSNADHAPAPQASTTHAEPEPATLADAHDAVEEPALAKPPVSVVPPRAPTEKVITEADPSAPKRGGWWQRAKATLTGEN